MRVNKPVGLPHGPFAGVYALVHTATGRMYVGSSHNITKRKGNHFEMLRRGAHHSTPLQRAYDDGGVEFRLLAVCDRDTAELIEQRALDAGWGELNRLPNARGGTPPGTVFSDERRARVSAFHTGRKRPPETGERISAAKRRVV